MKEPFLCFILAGLLSKTSRTLVEPIEKCYVVSKKFTKPMKRRAIAYSAKALNM